MCMRVLGTCTWNGSELMRGDGLRMLHGWLLSFLLICMLALMTA